MRRFLHRLPVGPDQGLDLSRGRRKPADADGEAEPADEGRRDTGDGQVEPALCVLIEAVVQAVVAATRARRWGKLLAAALDAGGEVVVEATITGAPGRILVCGVTLHGRPAQRHRFRIG